MPSHNRYRVHIDARGAIAIAGPVRKDDLPPGLTEWPQISLTLFEALNLAENLVSAVAYHHDENDQNVAVAVWRLDKQLRRLAKARPAKARRAP